MEQTPLDTKGQPEEFLAQTPEAAASLTKFFLGLSHWFYHNKFIDEVSLCQVMFIQKFSYPQIGLLSIPPTRA